MGGRLTLDRGAVCPVGGEAAPPDASNSSDDFIDRLVEAAGRRIGMEVSSHILRRTTAQLLRDRGARLEDIQGILQHRSIETTRIYLQGLERPGAMAQVANLLEAD